MSIRAGCPDRLVSADVTKLQRVPMPRTKKRRKRQVTAGDKVKAVLSRVRIDADAKRVYYDDTTCFVVFAERNFGKAIARYVFKDLEQAYSAATKFQDVRRYRWDVSPS